LVSSYLERFETAIAFPTRRNLPQSLAIDRMPAKKASQTASHTKKAAPPPKKSPPKKSPPKAAPPPPPAPVAKPAAKGKGKAAPPAKTIAKKPLKLVKIPTSALAERAKSKGRAIKAAAPFEHPDAEKVPQPRKSPPKKAAPPANEAVKEALKKVSTILAECIKSL
jgi:hypothetical protein